MLYFIVKQLIITVNWNIISLIVIMLIIIIKFLRDYYVNGLFLTLVLRNWPEFVIIKLLASRQYVLTFLPFDIWGWKKSDEG